MKVALLHNPKPAIVPSHLPDDAFEEYDSPQTIEAIAGALRKLGVDVEPVEADRQLASRLEAGCYDFAFNIAEGKGGRCRELVPAAVCELLDLPYTGSDPLTLGITLDKALARRVVSPELKVAPAVLIREQNEEALLESDIYPAIVKPNHEGSSKGIRGDAVVENSVQALEVVRRLRYPVLVEQFLPGAEVTVGMLGGRILGMMEIAAAATTERFVYSIETKRDWQRRVRYHVPPRVPPLTLAQLTRDALTAYHLLGCRDFARVDFRLDAEGIPRFLECNALPGLDPDNSDLVLLSKGVLRYDCLVQTILIEACKRHGVPLP